MGFNDNKIIPIDSVGAVEHPKWGRLLHESKWTTAEGHGNLGGLALGLFFTILASVILIQFQVLRRLDELDLLLLMTVNPGFGGQKFIQAMLPKISDSRELIDTADHDIALEVDGGVTVSNIAEVCRTKSSRGRPGTSIHRAASASPSQTHTAPMGQRESDRIPVKPITSPSSPTSTEAPTARSNGVP